ncbi:unnamed protein product [Angiostrongylus costaricensis]|uniref:Transmembrane protein 144 n=1 Tax=Angiostrongylus costaricensis TaxID=334426 RepID=A0A158PIQ2_ANGCS|nr:unnamed protein product [Angiostrongylus costaricensis]
MIQISNSSSFTTKQPSTTALVFGYVGLFLSCAAFGTMFTPLKRTNTKDGFFVQWVQCSVVLVIGFVVNVIQGFPPFQWIAATGGALFAIGNVLAVPVVNGLGMAIAFLIWGSLQIQQPYQPLLMQQKSGLMSQTRQEYRVLLTECLDAALWKLTDTSGEDAKLSSGVLFIFVKQSDGKSTKDAIDMERSDWTNSDVACDSNSSEEANWMLDYTWSFFSTVFVVSTIFFFLYCIIRRKSVYISKEVIIPAAGYGMLWSAGMVFWLISSDVLLQVIVYPIVTRVGKFIS